MLSYVFSTNQPAYTKAKADKIWRAMRITAIFLLATALTASATGNSQKITLKVRNTPLEQVFSEVKKQTGLSFLWDEATLKQTRPVTLNVKNATIEEVMKACVEEQPITYSILPNMVVIKQRQGSPIAPFPRNDNQMNEPPPSIDVKGRLVNENGEPVAGASVKVKGMNIGTTTNDNGEFSLSGIDPTATLIFSGTNIETFESKVSGRTSLELTAKIKESSMQEVIVNKGYYTEKQKLSTGNTATITSKDIEKQPVNNPLLALSGRVPGLVIQQANGIPGGGVTVRIQGRNNLDNSLVGSDPFIVIDGVPYASQNLSTFKGGAVGLFTILGSSSNDGIGSATTYGNPLAFINPSDIESITVLKDADATAIYGSRAANGAILITTKKGKPGKIKTDVNVQQGWGRTPKKMDLLNSQQYMEMRWEAKRNDNRAVSVTDYDLRGLWDTTRYTNWQDVLIGGTAHFTRMTAGVSGGTNTLQYLIGSTYGRETTVFPGDFANSFGSLHFNISASSSNQRFKIQLGGSYMNNTNELPAEDYTAHALNLPPVAPTLYNADGTLNWAPDPLQNGISSWSNPLARRFNLFDTKTNNLIANGSISYRIIPGLEFKTTLGFTSNTSDQFIAALDESEKPELRASRQRSATFSYNTSRSWIVEPQLSFQQKWGKHVLSMLAGTTFQRQNNNGRGFTANGHSSDLLLGDLLAGTSLSINGTDINEYKYNAVFGRINYSFKEKYIVNLTTRRDGSSRFGPKSQFNNFGAVGAGWIFSEETFFKNRLAFLSFGKIKGSYGTTGNDQIGNYKFLYLYRSANSTIPYQGESLLDPTGLPNPYLEWEETRKLQVGLDLGLWNDQLFITANYFQNRSSNSLTTIPMPVLTGFNYLVDNIDALIQNSGWEFLLNAVLINRNKTRWSTSINMTIPRNKLLAFPGLETSNLRSFMVIGQPLATTRTYPFYGVDPSTGLYLLRNINGEPTNTPTDIDRTVFLNRTPRWSGGIQNTFNYKGFSIDFLIQMTRQKASDILLLAPRPGFFSSSNVPPLGNQPAAVMDRWQKPGDNTMYQRYTTTTSTNEGDRSFRDASFIRMKNVSISYTVPTYITRGIKAQQLRLYANAQNVFTITRYHGLDPETQSVSSLPPLRMITVGLQATF